MKDRFVVFGYAIGYMILTILYCLPRFLAEFSTLDMSHVSEGFSIPLEIFAWGLLGICAVYCGMDRMALVKKTSLMECGVSDVGDKGKLLRVIFYLIIIFAENVILNLFLGRPFTIVNETGKQVIDGIQLPLDGISSALVATILAYLGGNKAIKFASNIDGEKIDTEKSKNN